MLAVIWVFVIVWLIILFVVVLYALSVAGVVLWLFSGFGLIWLVRVGCWFVLCLLWVVVYVVVVCACDYFGLLGNVVSCGDAGFDYVGRLCWVYYFICWLM